MGAGRPGPFLEEALRQFRRSKALAEAALAQVQGEAYFDAAGPGENSLALLVKHVAGNQRSRWTRFLETDGEKPDRARDTEFEREPGDTRAALEARWEQGWGLLFQALEPLREEDLGRVVTIRGEPHTVLQALSRQLAHYAYHVGQIVALARHHAGAAWQSLSIPRGQSAAYEARTRREAAAQPVPPLKP